MFDMVIKNGLILDGTGAAGYYGDIGIRDGKIARIGNDLTAEQTLNAKGLAVSPGWIDAHSHSDTTAMAFPNQKEKVEQGITLSVGGQCGGSAAPKDKMTMEDFFKQAGSVALGAGLAMLVGHGTIRRAVIGTQNAAPTPEQLERMKNLLRQSLKAGARGMSLGLIYIPGCYAEKEELIAMAKVVKEFDGVLAAHIRGEGEQVVEAVEEFISIVKASGCRGVISHHKAAERENWGKVKTTIAMIDEANAQGADIYMDVYPYCASKTSLLARFIPKRFHPQGVTDVHLLLDDPAIREQLTRWILGKWGEDLTWTLVVNCPLHKEYEGLNLNQIAALRGQKPHEAAFDLIREDGSRPSACYFSMCEEDVKTVLAHPRAMLCTDSGVAGTSVTYHPRLRASFPRALGKYVREEQVVTLPEMIRKMTSLPANVYGLAGKGRIAEGYDADLCIFAPDAITDRADFTSCSTPNEGLHYVVIDGKVVLEQGAYNGVRAAKLI